MSFKYDIFLSFASEDEKDVKPIWKELSNSGLRVFWSDAALKKSVGESWLGRIQKSLEESQHFVLICTPKSLNSKWVRTEWETFLSEFHTEGERRLIPILTAGLSEKNLPTFLKRLQCYEYTGPNSLDELIFVLGGTDIKS